MTDPRPKLSDRERVRLYLLHKRICHICNRAIDGTREPWDIEHVIPRNLLGRLADTDDNMRPAHRDCHRRKTKQDAANHAEAVRRETRHIGAHRSRHPIAGSRPLHAGEPAHRATAPLGRPLPPRRSLFVPESRS
ncbi:HNH endonuclease [Methylobacterium sp. JK268]